MYSNYIIIINIFKMNPKGSLLPFVFSVLNISLATTYIFIKIYETILFSFAKIRKPQEVASFEEILNNCELSII